MCSVFVFVFVSVSLSLCAGRGLRMGHWSRCGGVREEEWCRHPNSVTREQGGGLDGGRLKVAGGMLIKNGREVNQKEGPLILAI